LKQTLEKKIAAVSVGKDGRSEIGQLRLEIEEAEQVVRDMDLSSRNVPNYGVKIQQKITEYRTDVEKLKTTLRKMESQVLATDERDSLFAGGIREDMLATSATQRSSVLGTTDKLTNSSRQLKDALITAEETQQNSATILENLDEQTNTMKRIREGLGKINDSLNRGKRLLRIMSRRVMTNKLILALIILLILVGIGVVIWLGFFRKSSTTATTTTSTDQPIPTM